MTMLPVPESYWVEAGRLLAGEYPGDFHPETARRRIEAFLSAGIRAFVDLTEPHEHIPYEPILAEQARRSNLMVAYRRYPIRDRGVPERGAMSQMLDEIERFIEDNDPVYLHCWGGVGRTGVAVGCFLIRRGLSAEEALQRVNGLYQTRPMSRILRNSPETPEQFDFVRNWEEPFGARRRVSRASRGGG
jgi:hypothetical protein